MPLTANDFLPLKAPERLRLAAEHFAGRLVFASSLGAEDQVITDLIARLELPIPIITLDTGRLFPETYDLLAETEARYGLKIRTFSPDRAELEAFVNTHGINAFRESEDLRHACCAVRKLSALRRALAGSDLWICGLRQGQSVTRTDVPVLADDRANGLLKLSPLIDWDEARVWDYLRYHDVPYNPLHDRGFPSIGCACCTRAVRRVEDIRAGRWWWEVPEHRECGLHARPTPPEEK
ncbi:MAG: phosphoadenylyl-sulfate reductase [Candidatus Spyradenecus sp.]